MRVVLDTNVFISGLLWSGPPSLALAACLDGVAELVTAEPILAELVGTLTREFAVPGDRATAMAARIRSGATVAAIAGRHGWVIADPDDDKFVEAAIVGQADAIVSGDRDLRRLGTIEGIPVWTPREFLDQLAAP